MSDIETMPRNIGRLQREQESAPDQERHLQRRGAAVSVQSVEDKAPKLADTVSS